MLGGQTYGDEIVGTLKVLLLIFVVLKLTGNITWGWWWVLAPIWMPLAAVVLFVVVWVALMMAFGMIKP